MSYINSAVRFFSLLAGAVLFGGVTLTLSLLRVERAWAWGLIAGAALAILLAIFLAFVNYREHTKFEEARKRVEGVVLDFSLATVINIGRARRAYVFLTAETIRLFLWDKRPYLESTVRREEITVTYLSRRPNHVTIVFSDDDTLELIFPSAQDMLSSMRENGYRVEEEHTHV